MASVKMTFSLDQETADQLQRTSDSLRRSKSEIVREAISDFAERQGRLGEAEKRQLLNAIDEMTSRSSSRPTEDVDIELSEIRRARRGGGRRSDGTG